MQHAACSECSHINKHSTGSNTNLQGQILQTDRSTQQGWAYQSSWHTHHTAKAKVLLLQLYCSCSWL